MRIDTPKEADYFRHGGILPYVLRQLAGLPLTRRGSYADGRRDSLDAASARVR